MFAFHNAFLKFVPWGPIHSDLDGALSNKK